ncbi:MAG: DUF4199 domain-containing protein [Balneolaceae bacterium]|nr:DUF4199 domain-containing protein [Balneolaceae bacterium]
MKSYKTELKWALLFTGMMLSWMVMERLVGVHDIHIDKHVIVTNLIAIPAIAIYVFALLDKRKRDYNGYMSYKQGVVSGFVITLIVTVFSPLTQIITSTIISPDYFTNMIEYSVESEKMTRNEAENFFNLQSYLKQVVIGTPIMGFITTIIVAFFTKKTKS